jgi:mRNA interferase HigB
MHIVSKRVLFEKAERFADAAQAVDHWFSIARHAEWNSLEEIRRDFPATDIVGPLAIFNVRGNNYRLIVRVSFRKRILWIKEFLTHAEYSKKRWHKWL